MHTKNFNLIPNSQWPWIRRYLIDCHLDNVQKLQAQTKHSLLFFTDLPNETIADIEWHISLLPPHTHIYPNQLSFLKKAFSPHFPGIYGPTEHLLADLPYQVLVPEDKLFVTEVHYLASHNLHSLGEIQLHLPQANAYLPHFKILNQLNLIEDNNPALLSQLIPELTWNNYFSQINLNYLHLLNLADLDPQLLLQLLRQKRIFEKKDTLQVDPVAQCLTFNYSDFGPVTCRLTPGNVFFPATLNRIITDSYEQLLLLLLFPNTYMFIENGVPPINFWHNIILPKELAPLKIKALIKTYHPAVPERLAVYFKHHSPTMANFFKIAPTLTFKSLTPPKIRGFIIDLLTRIKN